MSHVTQDDVNQALTVLGLTLPVTPETLDRAKRVQLYTWNPARYSNLTNNPKKYMESYKKAEEMTKLIEASYTLLTAVLVPEEGPPGQSPSWPISREAQPVTLLILSRRMIKTPCNKAAGRMATEAYPLGYVAGRHTTENAVR